MGNRANNTKHYDRDRFIPCTPGGTILFHLAAATEAEAIKHLMKNASHMPYRSWEDFKQRGYEILDTETMK